jgi:hypothetical protein
MMTEHIHSPSHHKQAEPQAVWFGRIDTMEGVEDFRQLVGRDANAGIMDLDAHVGPAAPTAQQNSPARPRVFDRVAEKIAQDPFKEDRVAQNRHARWTDANCDAILLHQFGILPAQGIQ